MHGPIGSAMRLVGSVWSLRSFGLLRSRLLGSLLRRRSGPLHILLAPGEGHVVEYLVESKGPHLNSWSTRRHAGLRAAARMCAPARHAQARRSVSSSAWPQPASRRQRAQATGRGLRRRESRPASLGCRGLDS
eukprot:scaffold19101_cov53-Phaeocystis_antarctica.AAC.4